MKILCGAALATALSGAVLAQVGPRVDRPSQPDFRRLHRSQHELRDPGRPQETTEQPRSEQPRSNGQLDADERRALGRDLDRANREIYQK